MKLRIILMALSSLAFLSVWTGGYLYYASLKASAFKDAEKQAELHAESIKNHLSSFLGENLNSVRALAGLKGLPRALSGKNIDSLAKANSILDHFKDALKVDVCYLMDVDGTTLASSNRSEFDSFVGKNYAFRPYFQQAIQGAASIYMALGVTSKKRGVYYSYPVYGEKDEPPIGVAVIKAVIDPMEKDFSKAYEGTVLLIDPNGVIFISSRNDWLYHLLWKLPPKKISEIARSKQFGEGPWRWTGLESKDEVHAVDHSGNEYLIRQISMDNYPGWNIVFLRSIRSISKKVSGPLMRTTVPIILTLCILIGLSVFYLYRKASHDIVQRTKEITSILENTPAVVFVKNKAFQYQFVNSQYEELFHIKNEEVQGKTDYDIFSKDTSDQFRENDLKVLEEGQPFQVEERVPQKDGIHTYLSVKFPLYDEHGAVQSFCGIATDITELKKAQDQSRRLSARIMNGQEKERAAIARELHDELGQMLTALRMESVWLCKHLKKRDPKAGERALTMCNLVDKTIDEVRSMAIRLRPKVLDDLGLMDALEWFTTEFEKRSGIVCVFNHFDVPYLKDIISTAAYRITQEALTNVARHSSATHVEVILKAAKDILTLSVSDNGAGFDIQNLSDTDSLGIAGMRERANLVGGNLEILSRPGNGTQVFFKVPIHDNGAVDL